jgi:crotonobetainyl-CoA:carnitine CoA-transferase CaiB-like acyl-CoA transferase
MGPLQGIRVLDLSRVLAGPWATQALADYGAEVWKVERPGAGDDTRAWGPPWLRDGAGAETRESAYFLGANRGKQSLAIDLAQAQGQELIRALAQRADVVVENFKVGALARYGLDAAALLAVNPRLVYCSISAFGQDGPDAAAPGYDAMIQARGGLMSITGLPDGEPGGGPQKVGVAVVDLMTGMYAVSAITAALFERERSGLGQHIDLALMDTQVAWLANQAMNYLVGGKVPQRQGTAHPNIVPYQAFPTRDGHLMLAVGNDRQYRSLCTVAGEDACGTDPRFATNAARVANRAVLVPLVTAWLARRDTAWWLTRLGEAEVPCGPINDLAQVFADPQVVHRGLRIDLPHATGGQAPGVRPPARFSRSGLKLERAPPLLGQHTREVLSRELGLDAAALDGLAAAGIIG